MSGERIRGFAKNVQRSVEGVRLSLVLGWVVLSHFTGRNIRAWPILKSHVDLMLDKKKNDPVNDRC